MLNCRPRRAKVAQCPDWVALLVHLVEDPCRSGRPGAGQKLDDAKPSDAIARVFCPAQKREQVFNMCGLEKL